MVAHPDKPAGQRYRSGNKPERVSKNSTDLEQLRLKAVALRLEGKTYNQVAEAIGVTYETAYGYVRTVLNRQTKELVPELRAVEDARLDMAVAEAVKIIKAHSGTELALKAIDRLLRAVAARAALQGLNAPVEVSITEHTQMDHEIAGLLQQQDALNQRTHRQIVDGELVGETDAPTTPA